MRRALKQYRAVLYASKYSAVKSRSDEKKLFDSEVFGSKYF
jgi:hypothetical protein